MPHFWPIPQHIDDMLRDKHAHQEYLRTKYPQETLLRYEELMAIAVATGETQDDIRLTDFAFTTGIYRDARLDTMLRSRWTLEQLLKLPWQEPPRTIVDLGCGSGEITKGLALYFDSARVIAVDLLESALQRTQEMSDEQKRVIDGRLITVHGDYTEPATVEKIISAAGTQADLTLITYQPHDLPALVRPICTITKPDGVIAAAFVISPLNYKALGTTEEEAKVFVTNDNMELFGRYGITREYLAHTNYRQRFAVLARIHQH